MTAPTGPFCICGALIDNRGACAHCDTKGDGPCSEACANCRNRDHHCAVCRTRCITIPAALLHERRCRGAEILQRKKP